MTFIVGVKSYMEVLPIAVPLQGRMSVKNPWYRYATYLLHIRISFCTVLHDVHVTDLQICDHICTIYDTYLLHKFIFV